MADSAELYLEYLNIRNLPYRMHDIDLRAKIQNVLTDDSTKIPSSQAVINAINTLDNTLRSLINTKLSTSIFNDFKDNQLSTVAYTGSYNDLKDIPGSSMSVKVEHETLIFTNENPPTPVVGLSEGYKATVHSSDGAYDSDSIHVTNEIE